MIIINCDDIEFMIKEYNNIYISSYEYYYKFLDILYSSNSMINGVSINKNFKIYNLCDYNYYKSYNDYKKTSLFHDYIHLKIQNINENEKEEIIKLSEILINNINSNLNLENSNVDIDIDSLIYDLISINESDNDKSISDMLDYIFKNSNLNYILIYDSTLLNVNNYDNVIVFDINNNKLLEKYNISFIDKKIKNINIDIIVDNFLEYWPLCVKKESLYNLINNNFFNIYTKNNIITDDDNMVILVKLINYFYGRNILINYNGNNNTVKSFLSSYLKY